jgi:putative ABC transport system ATP-binding protein
MNSAGTAENAVLLRSVHRAYGRGAAVVTALDNVSHAFPKGSFTAVMGPSGSGKSTLLHCAAGLDKPQSGEIYLDGQPLHTLNEAQLTELRRRRIGFIFQSFNLLPALTVTQNITLPLELDGRTPDKRLVGDTIAALGLHERAGHRPSQLSGGQQQRTAIARAIVAQPAVIFADEPTGALDSQAAGDVLGLLREAATRRQQTVIMVTHDPLAASYADRVVFMLDGRLAGTLTAPSPEQITDWSRQLTGAVGGGRRVEA